MPLTLYDLEQMKPEERECYAEGILYQGQMVFLVGAQKTGKSYIVDQLGVCLAAGKDWGNGKIKIPKPRNVLVYQTEGNAEDLAERTNPIFETLTKKERDVANGNFLGELPETVDLTGTARNTGIPVLEKYLTEYNVEVLIVDSLFSTIRGSFTQDATMIEFRATMIGLLRRHPKLSVIFLHHEHRPLHDRDGNLIDQGANAYAGSWVIGAMADMFWLYTRESSQNGDRRRFDTAFSRMRLADIDPFYVTQDSETGLIIPDAASLSDNIWKVRREFIRRKTMTGDAYKSFIDNENIKYPTAMRYVKDLTALHVLKREGKRGSYVYRWIGKQNK